MYRDIDNVVASDLVSPHMLNKRKESQLMDP